MEKETEDRKALNAAALALYKLDHPGYEADSFDYVPLLATVTTYRHRAWVVWDALRKHDITTDRGFADGKAATTTEGSKP